MKKTLQQRLLEILKDNPGISVKELALILEVDISKIKVATYRLKSMGYIEKAGKGYIVTKRGLQFLDYLESRSMLKTGAGKVRATIEEGYRAAMKISPSEESMKETSPSISIRTPQAREDAISTFIEKLQELEERIANLEARVKSLEKAITSTQKRPNVVSLPDPVMHYNEAVAKYGSLVEKMLSDGKLVRVGSLVVDSEFYVHFKSKFPIRLPDVEKLSLHEKTLLEEMRKEALVVLHAGREYRVIE